MTPEEFKAKYIDRLAQKYLREPDKVTMASAYQALNQPQKDAIQRAFDLYGHNLNPFNSYIYESVWQTPNVEGRFLACNIPEIESIVIDKVCSEEVLYETLDKHDDITHIGLSTYANGMNNSIKLIKIIKSDFPDKKLYIGGIGV